MEEPVKKILSVRLLLKIMPIVGILIAFILDLYSIQLGHHSSKPQLLTVYQEFQNVLPRIFTFLIVGVLYWFFTHKYFTNKFESDDYDVITRGTEADRAFGFGMIMFLFGMLIYLISFIFYGSPVRLLFGI